MLMRRLGGAAAALVLGLSVSARADDTAAPSGGSRWYDKLNPFASKKPEDPQVPPTVPLPGGTAQGQAAAPVEAGATGPGESEQDALFRRNQVCFALLQIAYDTHNEQLRQRVELLLQLVNDVYQLRTEYNPNRFVSDEATLSQRLGTGDGRRGLDPTEQTRPERRTVNLPEDR